MNYHFIVLLDLFYFYNKKRQLNLLSPEEVLKACPCGVIASGGVAGAEDVARLAEMAKAYPNLVGAIVGKALYEGRCDVAGLLKATGER